MLATRTTGKNDLRAMSLLSKADFARSHKKFQKAAKLEGEAQSLLGEEDSLVRREDKIEAERHLQALIKRPKLRLPTAKKTPQKTERASTWKPLLLQKPDQLVEGEEQKESNGQKSEKHLQAMTALLPALVQQSVPRMGQGRTKISEEQGVSSSLAAGGASLVAADPASGSMLLLLGVAVEAASFLEENSSEDELEQPEAEVEETKEAEFGWLVPGKGYIAQQPTSKVS